MPTDKPFLSFVVDEELLEAIDDYRFRRRYASRAEAVRDLIRKGLNEAQMEAFAEDKKSGGVS